MTVIDIHVEVAADSIAAARRSIDSVGLVFAEYCAAKGVPNDFNAFAANHGVTFDDVGDLFVVEHADRPAGGTSVLEAFEFQPADIFLKLVAALAVDADADATWVGHGWPILSVVDRTTTVDRRRRVAMLAAKGAA